MLLMHCVTCDKNLCFITALAQLVVTFYMNLTAVINAEDKKNVSGAMMVSMGVVGCYTLSICVTESVQYSPSYSYLYNRYRIPSEWRQEFVKLN